MTKSEVPLRWRPVPRLLNAADTVAVAVEALWDGIHAWLSQGGFGEYEADALAFGLLSVISRNTAAVDAVASLDRRYVTAAMAAGRAAYEPPSE